MTAILLGDHPDGVDGWRHAVREAGKRHRISQKKYRVSRRKIRGERRWCVYTAGKIKEHR